MSKPIQLSKYQSGDCLYLNLADNYEQNQSAGQQSPKEIKDELRVVLQNLDECQVPASDQLLILAQYIKLKESRDSSGFSKFFA